MSPVTCLCPLAISFILARSSDSMGCLWERTWHVEELTYYEPLISRGWTEGTNGHFLSLG